MKNKIFGALIGLTLGAVILAAFFTVFILYRTTERTFEAGLREEVSYIKSALKKDATFLDTLPKDSLATRITLIAPSGKVLFDSWKSSTEMDNHNGRLEVLTARKSGTGKAKRPSDTLKKDVCYYAEKMDDGKIIRIARPTETVWPIVYKSLPSILGVVILGGLIAYFMAKKLTNNLLAPLNRIDLDHPLNNDTYKELTPFLERIEKQRKDLREDFEKLLAAENLRREFSANVSHELKTPLQSISGYAEIINNGIARTEDVPRFVEKISIETARLINMVDGILKISKLDESEIQIQLQSLDLKKVCQKVILNLTEKARKRHIEIKELVYEDSTVMGMPLLMEEVIFNLVENAIKYNKEGGNIIVSGGPRAGDIVLEVKDTGLGISKEALPRIFERFFREDKSHNSDTSGSGLGLAIVKHGVTLQGGTIKVDSIVGEGTVFTLTFESARNRN